MPDFADLASHQTIPVKFHDVTVQVTYDPGVLTTALLAEAEGYAVKQRRLASQASTKAEADRFAQPELRYLLCRAIKAWDLTQGGQPYPIEEEALAKLPSELLVRISNAVRENEAPKEPSEGSLGDG